MQVQLPFMLNRVTEFAPKNPDWKNRQQSLFLASS
jgi:hypothetical protein